MSDDLPALATRALANDFATLASPFLGEAVPAARSAGGTADQRPAAAVGGAIGSDAGFVPDR